MHKVAGFKISIVDFDIDGSSSYIVDYWARNICTIKCLLVHCIYNQNTWSKVEKQEFYIVFEIKGLWY